MRVVVTGATGNVGTSVLAALRSAPGIDHVVGVARRLPGDGYRDVEWHQADVGRTSLEPAFRGADAVIHLAWAIQPSRDGDELERVNVTGTRRVLAAAARAGCGRIVYASSVGAYAGVSPASRSARVDESHPVTGIPTSVYSSQKAKVEGMLDEWERGEGAGASVARLRPALIFKRDSAMEIRRYFAGPFIPNRLLSLGRPPLVPVPRGLRFQAVHADDVGRAYAAAVVTGAEGAYNLAAEPELNGDALAGAIGGRAVEVSPRALRSMASVSWKLHLQPTPAGWLDMAMDAPLMDTSRARSALGWEPEHGAEETLAELIGGLADGSGGDTPPLDARAGGRFRLGEIASGVGRTAYPGAGGSRE